MKSIVKSACFGEIRIKFVKKKKIIENNSFFYYNYDTEKVFVINNKEVVYAAADILFLKR